MLTLALRTKILQNCDLQVEQTSNCLTKPVSHQNRRINRQKVEAKVGFRDAANRVTRMMLQSRQEIIWDIVNRNYQLINQQLKKEKEIQIEIELKDTCKTRMVRCKSRALAGNKRIKSMVARKILTVNFLIKALTIAIARVR